MLPVGAPGGSGGVGAGAAMVWSPWARAGMARRGRGLAGLAAGLVPPSPARGARAAGATGRTLRPAPGGHSRGGQGGWRARAGIVRGRWPRAWAPRSRRAWPPPAPPWVSPRAVARPSRRGCPPAGPWGPPARRQATRPHPPPRGRPRPPLRAAPGGKPGRQRRVGRGRPRVVVGPGEAVPPG